MLTNESTPESAPTLKHTRQQTDIQKMEQIVGRITSVLGPCLRAKQKDPESSEPVRQLQLHQVWGKGRDVTYGGQTCRLVATACYEIGILGLKGLKREYLVVDLHPGRGCLSDINLVAYMGAYARRFRNWG